MSTVGEGGLCDPGQRGARKGSGWSPAELNAACPEPAARVLQYPMPPAFRHLALDYTCRRFLAGLRCGLYAGQLENYIQELRAMGDDAPFPNPSDRNRPRAQREAQRGSSTEVYTYAPRHSNALRNRNGFRNTKVNFNHHNDSTDAHDLYQPLSREPTRFAK